MDFFTSRQTVHPGCGKSGFRQVFCKDYDIMMEICGEDSNGGRWISRQSATWANHVGELPGGTQSWAKLIKVQERGGDSEFPLSLAVAGPRLEPRVSFQEQRLSEDVDKWCGSWRKEMGWSKVTIPCHVGSGGDRWGM